MKSNFLSVTLWLSLAFSAQATTYTITTTNDSGAGSLRQAMLDANAAGGSNSIVFNIAPGGHQVITPLTNLPTLNVAAASTFITIDGTTQPGYAGAPLIELAGGGLAIVGSGISYNFTLTGGFAIRGLVLNHGAGVIVNNCLNTLNSVQRCYLGTDFTGRNILGGTIGILLTASVATIGGTNAVDGNLIAGCVITAISAGSVGPPFMGVANAGLTAQNNLIGTDITGTNVLGNTGSGLVVSLAGAGMLTVQSNVIAGCQQGISLSGMGGNIVGNAIGTDRTGTLSMGNRGAGVTVYVDSYVYGSFPLFTVQDNQIEFNGGPGVSVTSGRQVLISSNSIYGNGGIGIDVGANNLQFVPVVAAATRSGGYTVIRGTFTATPQTSFTLEFFSTPDLDLTDNGEGKIMLGTTVVNTDASGSALLNLNFPVVVPIGQYVTVTARDAVGSTSAFSVPAQVVSGPTLPTLALSSTNIALADGSSGTTNALFTLTLSSSSAQTVTVDYTTADGSARAGTDYQAASGRLTFTPGQRTNTIAVPVIGTALYKTNVIFQLLLSNPTNAVLTTLNATATILNDDPLPSLSINDLTLHIVPSILTNAVFTVNLSGPAAVPISVDCVGVSGSSTVASQGKTSTLTFNPGETNQTVSIWFIGPQQLLEFFTANLSNPVNASLQKSQGIALVYKVETVPVSVTDATVTSSPTAATNITFTVSLAATNSTTINVGYYTSDNTALAGVDYQYSTGQVNFIPGETNKTISVLVPANPAYKSNVTFYVTLTNANTILNRAQAVGTIVCGTTPPVNLLLPSLAVRLIPSKVVLSWPANFTNFSLYVTSDPADSNSWQLLTANPPQDSGQFIYTNSATVPKKFYRLKR